MRAVTNGGLCLVLSHSHGTKAVVESPASIKAVTLHASMHTPVKYVKRIGERIAAGLAERGIETVEDLLYHLPFRYEDRLHPKPLSAYTPGEWPPSSAKSAAPSSSAPAPAPSSR